jgi:hypothetical protein
MKQFKYKIPTTNKKQTRNEGTKRKRKSNKQTNTKLTNQKPNETHLG